jgi:hypothetical protein
VIFTLSVAFLAVSLAALGVFRLAAARRAKHRVTVMSVEHRTPDVAAYAVTYLLPFLVVFDGTWRDVLALALFVGLIGVIYVNSGMLYVNPVLALFGYHLFLVRATTVAEGVDAEDLQPHYLLTKNRWLRRNEILTVREVMPDTLFAFPRDNPDAS